MAKKGKDCGFGIYIGTIPIYEGPKAAACRRESEVEKLGIRKEASTEKTIARQEANVYQSAFRNLDGVTPAEGAIGSIAGAYGQIGAAAAPIAIGAATGGASLLPSLFGGALESLGLVSESETGSAEIEILPIVLAASAVAVVAAVVLSGGK